MKKPKTVKGYLKQIDINYVPGPVIATAEVIFTEGDFQGLVNLFHKGGFIEVSTEESEADVLQKALSVGKILEPNPKKPKKESYRMIRL